jgi:hypothetical protein
MTLPLLTFCAETGIGVASRAIKHTINNPNGNGKKGASRRVRI